MDPARPADSEAIAYTMLCQIPFDLVQAERTLGGRPRVAAGSRARRLVAIRTAREQIETCVSSSTPHAAGALSGDNLGHAARAPATMHGHVQEHMKA